MTDEHESVASLRQSLVALVLDKGYERRAQPFALSAGGTSHDYVDMRRAVASGPDLALGAEVVIATLADAEVTFDAIGGMTMGADPVAHAVALVSGKSWFSVRKEEKRHGSGRRIEGCQLTPAIRAVVFEDTTSTGRSILEAADAVLDAGARIVAAVTLLDRGDEARRHFSKRTISYFPILTYEDIGIDPLRPATV